MTTGSVLAQFTITLSQAVSEQVAVEWHTADGTALAGVDYAAAKGTVLFAPGQTAKTVDILVHGRAVGSEDRSFFVEMLPPTNAILGASIGECIIHVDTTGSTPVTQILVPTGPRGLQGDSAYQSWLDLGNTGTEQDFINSLKPSAAEIAQEVAPLIDLSNSPLTAEGTETLSKPDTITGKRLARRVAYVGAAKVATVVLADGDNLITHADLSGDAVDFNSISLYPRILRGTAVISPEWSVELGDKILIKSAVAGDVLHVCQYDVISERAVRNAVEPLGSQAFEALRRGYAEAGLNVKGYTKDGVTLTSTSDVVIHSVSGKGYSWNGVYPEGGYFVTPETDPTLPGSGYVPRTDVVLRDDLSAPNGVDLVGNAAKASDLSILRADYDLQTRPQNLTAFEWSKKIADGIAPKIVGLGDSTMWGATVGALTTQTPNNPPAQLASALNRLTGLTFSVTNRAVSGSSLYEMIRGLAPFYSQTFAQELDTTSADRDIIYCNHCINDSQTDRNITTYKEDLITFIRECRVRGKTPILVTPNPNPQLLIIDETKSKRLANYVKVMREVAERTGCDLVDNYALFMASTNLFRIDELVPDGAHMSNDAYRQYGYNLAIPLVSANTISEVGDITGLGNSTYFDNLTVSRSINWQGNRAGGVLTANRAATEQGINYAFILGRASNALSVLGLHWESGAKCVATVNALILGEYYPTQRHGDYTKLDWDSQRNFYERQMAGLKVLGINFNMTDTGIGNGISFAGVTIPKLTNTVVNNESGKSPLGYRIDCRDTVFIKDFNLASPLVFRTTKGDNAMTIEIISGVITIKLFEVTGSVQTVTMGSSVIVGKYDIYVSQNNEAITVYVGSLATVFNAVAPLPNLIAPVGSTVLHIQPTFQV